LSESHARRLAKVRDEKEAAEEAVDACRKNYGELRHLIRSDPLALESAARNLEKTYYTRLCADTEAMLYRHFQDHWPALRVLVNATGAQLINHARHHLNPSQNNSLDTAVADRALQVMDYRNYLAHGEKSRQPEIRFYEALDSLQEILLKLPPMK
jgi:hypothetical protein